MRSAYVILITAVGVVACTSRLPSVGDDAMPAVAHAPEAGIIAIAGPVPGTVRVLFARNGGMALVREIRVPSGQRVIGLSVSADGRDFVIETQAMTYSTSMGSWKLEAVGLFGAARLVDASVR